jgi:ribosome maturation factor RimP
MRVEKWAWPTFFTPRPQNSSNTPGMNDPTEQELQQELSELDGDIDLVALEKPRNDALRLFIDHPNGVDLALCERVSKHLKHLLVDYSLEVSSPGPKYRDRRNATSSENKESLQ